MTTTDFTFPTCLIVTKTRLSTITTVRPRSNVYNQMTRSGRPYTTSKFPYDLRQKVIILWLNHQVDTSNDAIHNDQDRVELV